MRRAAELAERGLEAIAGRRNIVRASRFVLDRARLDGPNRIETNGELNVQQLALRTRMPGPVNVHRCPLPGVAAPRSILRSGLPRRCVSVSLHVFEPSRYTFDRLTKALGPPTEALRMNPMAISSRPGIAVLHKPHEGAGSSSLHERPHSDEKVEEVSLTTLDIYCSSMSIKHVHLLKIDAEGHDLAALEGGRRLFAEGRVDIAQFEYNVRWVDARHYLRDAFEFAAAVDYRIGKVTPRGIEFYAAWHPELESFKEGNYVLIRRTLENHHVEAVTWWGP